VPAAAVIHKEQALSALTGCNKYIGNYNLYYKKFIIYKYSVYLIIIIYIKSKKLIVQR